MRNTLLQEQKKVKTKEKKEEKLMGFITPFPDWIERNLMMDITKKSKKRLKKKRKHKHSKDLYSYTT